MRYLLRVILAGGLGFAAALLIAACGGGAGLLSGDQSSTLSDQLDKVSAALAAGNCAGVSKAATALNNSAGSLPATVSVTLRNNLIQGASTVAELARRDCHQTTTADTTPTTPTATATAPTATQTTTTPTTETSTSPSTPPPTTPTTPTTPATTPTTPGTTPSGGTGGAGLGDGGGNGGTGIGTPGAGSNG
jgi:hypothetical protein